MKITPSHFNWFKEKIGNIPIKWIRSRVLHALTEYDRKQSTKKNYNKYSFL